MHKLYTRRNLIASFIFIAGVVILVVFFTYRNIRQSIQQTRNAHMSLQSLRALEDLMDDMQDIETGQRGFLVSQNPAFLEPYREGLENLSKDTMAIHNLYLLYPERVNTYRRLLDFVRQKQQIANKSVSLLGQGKRDSAFFSIQTGEGRKLMDSIRQLIFSIETKDRWVLQQSNNKREDAALNTTRFLIAMVIIFFAGLSWLLWRLLKEESARRKDEQQIAYLARLTEQASDAIFSTDTGGLILSWNKGAERLYGYRKEEVIGKFAPEITRSGNKRDNITFLAASLKDEGNIIEEALHYDKQGRAIYCLVSASGIYSEQKELTGYVVVLRDITERKKAEQFLEKFNDELALRVEEKTTLVKNIVERIRDGFFSLDNKGCFTYVNDYMLELTGKTQGELIGEVIWAAFPDTIGTPAQTHLLKAMDEQRQSEFEIYYAPFKKWFSSIVYPSPTGISVIFRDVTGIKQAEEDIRRSNERLYLISRTTNDAIWDWDLETGEVWGNETHQELYGLGASDPVPDARQWQSRLHPDDRDWLIKKQNEALASDTNIFITEYRFRTNKRGYRYIYDRCYIVRNKEGKAIRMLGSMMDVTDRKRTEEALQQSEAKYRAYFENSLDGILLTSPGGEIFAANPAACAIFGMTEKEICEAGRNGITDTTDPRLGKLLQDRELTGKAKGEITLIRKGGKKFPADISSAVFSDATGSVRTSMIIRDVTEQKKAEQLLQERENHLRTILNTEPECIKLLDPDGKLLEMNPAGLEMIEADNLEMVQNKSVLGIIQPEFRESFSQLINDVYRDKPGKLIFEIRGLKGTRRWLDTHAVPMKDEKGKIISLLGITRDITEKRKAEQAILSSEETRRLIMSSALDAIVCIDTKGLITVWTPQAEKIFGWNEKDILGRSLTETIIPVRYRDQHKEGMQRYAATGEGPVLRRLLELSAVNREGSEFPIEISIIPVQQGETEFFCAFIRDITERKKAEKALRESEEKLRQILDSATDDFYVIDRNYRVILVNKTAQDNLEQVWGKKVTAGTYMPDIFPDNRKKIIIGNYDKVFNGERVEYEIPVQISNKTYWRRVQYGPVRDENGRITGAFITTADITERKTAEEDIVKSNARFQIMSKATSDIVWDLDVTTGVLWWNDKYYENLGYLKQEKDLYADDWFSHIHPDERDKVRTKFYEALSGTASAWRDEYRYRRSDGTYLHMLDRGYIMRNSDNIAYRMIGSMVDMTPVYEVQNKVIESENRMRTILDTDPECIQLIDAQCIMQDINKAGLEMIEAESAEKVAGLQVLGLVGEEQRVEFAGLIREAFAGNNGRLEYGMITLKGKKRWCEANIVPFRNADNGVISALAVTRDITEKKKAELELARNEEKYRTLVEQASDGIFILNQQGRFLTVNNSCTRISGYSEEELTNMTIYDVSVQDDLAKTPPKFAELLKGKATTTERKLRKKGGGVIDIEITAKQLSEGNILVFARDITERKKAEEALKQNEEKYRTLVEQAVDAIALYDATGKILDVNTGSVHLLGYTRAELLGMSLSEVLTGEEIRDNPVRYDVLQQGKSTIKQRKMRRKDGSIIVTEVRSQQLPDGRFLSIIRDLTERIEAEQELQESYRALRELTGHLQNIREEERSNIAREIHDELGQQLTVLKMDISWLSNKWENPGEKVQERLKGLLEMIDNTVKSVRRISSELRPSMLDDLGLPAAIEWHAQEFGKRSGIRIHTQVDTGDVKLPEKVGITLFRVYQECLTNVVRHSGADQVNVQLYFRNKKLHLEVQDNGKGFLRKEIENKKTLGILGMKERVSLIKGEYSIESKPGKGTTVRVRVPLEELH